jgi:hypothetical protein
MSTIDDSVGKLARVYDSATDTWVPLIGAPAPHEHTTASTLAVSGSASVGTNLSVSGSASFTGDLEVTGLFSVNEIIESIPTLSIVSGSVSVNFATANNYYVSSPSANFGVIITNLPTTNDKSTGISLMVVQGATGYYPNSISINGANQTIRWSGGTPPVPTSTAGDIDIYNFSFIRKSNSWIVLGSSNIDF